MSMLMKMNYRKRNIIAKKKTKILERFLNIQFNN